MLVENAVDIDVEILDQDLTEHRIECPFDRDGGDPAIREIEFGTGLDPDMRMGRRRLRPCPGQGEQKAGHADRS